MTVHEYIRDLDSSQFVEGTYCIQNAQLGQTKNGKQFLKALISDKTGRVTARMWNIADQVFSALPVNGFVWLEGQTQPYQGELQLIINDIRATEVSETQIKELLPTSAYDLDQMYGEVMSILRTLDHPAMRTLAQVYLEDEALMRRVKFVPAATTLHHAYLGGLLEHTLALMRLADKILPMYPELNRDLVMMGLFLHDLSKADEIAYEYGFEYTDEGLLLGHLVMGSLLLQKKALIAAERPDGKLPRNALLVLHHIIISHHTQPEYGAARIPATPEAILVARLDDLDAKTRMAIDAARPDEPAAHDLGGHFTERLWALGTRIYKPDPLA